MRIVFMGTPDFSVPVLEALCEAGHDVAAVVTQPDKPKGRGKGIQYPPVKAAALERKIPVYQPVRVKDEAFIQELQNIAADVIVVVAFGQILPSSILHMPKFGCVNVHASLLPKYRGAAPIQWAIIEGEQQTGVTAMQMDEGLDTGDMLLKSVVEIDEKETGGSLHDKLSKAGAVLILETLEKLEAGTLVPEKQKDEESNYAKMLDKKLGKMDFHKSAKELERLIRGLNPWPSAYTTFRGKMLKIWSAEVREQTIPNAEGKIVEVNTDSIGIGTAKGILYIKELQLEGKKRMDAESFLRGCDVQVNELLGDH